MYIKEGWKCCSQMKREEMKEVILPLGSKKYGKLVCLHCDHFIKWIPSPKTIKEIEDRQRKIQECLDQPNFPSRDRQFLEGIKDKRFICPKEKTILDYILQ